jgi:glutathione-regulated potassium-efflux system ancillary protein KefG
MAKVLVLFAHPRLERSRSNKALLRALPAHPNITFRDLYELYPDFNVDIGKEQALLLAHEVIVWHHPLYWYSAPPLLKQWIDLVLAFGWAYGPGGTALRGKTVFQAITSGGASEAYTREGYHASTLKDFLRPMQRTVTLCGMHWLPPFAVHGTHRLSEAELGAMAQQYARLLLGFAEGRLDPAQLGHLDYLNHAGTLHVTP